MFLTASSAPGVDACLRLLLSNFQGPPDNRGITYRAFDELFRMAKAVWGAYEYTFHVNLMEVYNEVIRDLLVSKVRTPCIAVDAMELMAIDHHDTITYCMMSRVRSVQGFRVFRVL